MISKTYMIARWGALCGAAALLAGCGGPGDDRAETPDRYDGIAESETVTLAGTEPFWSMVVTGDQLTYSTPDNIDGAVITISRFAGNNGVGFSGELDDEALQIAVTPGACSDGMSDGEYPFTATVTLGDRTLNGCGYTDSQPITGGNGE